MNPVSPPARFFRLHLHCCCCHCCVLELLCQKTDKAMQDVFGAEYVSLHVRVSNKGAIHLYTQTLGYE